jgi:hypothetical protein
MTCMYKMSGRSLGPKRGAINRRGEMGTRFAVAASSLVALWVLDAMASHRAAVAEPVRVGVVLDLVSRPRRQPSTAGAETDAEAEFRGSRRGDVDCRCGFCTVDPHPPMLC